MKFIVPMVNGTLKLVEADPFTLLHKRGNQTCSIFYTGPKNAIVSSSDDCVYATDVQRRDLIVAPTENCREFNYSPETSRYFELDSCRDSHPGDEKDFVQVKVFNTHYHVYCFGSEMTIGGITKPCTRVPFLLPLSANFKINNQLYGGREYHEEHHEKLDPIFSTRTNWHLNPNLDLDDLVKALDYVEKKMTSPVESDGRDRTKSHFPWFIAIIVILTITFGALLGLAFFVVKFRKIRIMATTTEPEPMMP
jgi:hypothetical protein